MGLVSGSALLHLKPVELQPLLPSSSGSSSSSSSDGGGAGRDGGVLQRRKRQLSPSFINEDDGVMVTTSSSGSPRHTKTRTDEQTTTTTTTTTMPPTPTACLADPMDINPGTSAATATTTTGIEGVRKAVMTMQSCLVGTDVKETILILAKYIDNIVGRPGEDRTRRIR